MAVLPPETIKHGIAMLTSCRRTQVPPPDCFSCFLVAVSNLYPGVYHTFATPFSIGSHEHSDLRSQQCVPLF